MFQRCRQMDTGVYFTHDSLLQTLQVLFSLLMAFMQESEGNSKTIIFNRTIFLRTSGLSNILCFEFLSALCWNLRGCKLDCFQSVLQYSIFSLEIIMRRPPKIIYMC